MTKFAMIAVLALGIGLGACAPRPGGGGGSTFSPEFMIPEDGATLHEEFTLEVAGKGVTRVYMRMEGTTIYDSIDPPFAVTIDGTTFPKGTYRITITAQASTGKEAKQTIFLKLGPVPVPLADILAAMDNLGPGEWYEIPDSHLRDVEWVPTTATEERGDVSGLTSASGGTFDSERDRLIVWGGGSGAYYGNEVYAFDVDTASWMRLNDPSAFPPGEENNPFDLKQHPDGSPIQRHTYDHIEYIPPPVDRMILGGGSGLWRTGQSRDLTTYYFDFDALTWESLDPCASVSFGAVGAVGPNNHYWQLGAQAADRNMLSEFNPDTGTWTAHVGWGDWRDGQGTAEIDPIRNLFVLVGGGLTATFDLNNPDVDKVIQPTTGDTEIELDIGPGLAYHTPSGKLVAWAGGPDVYVLDLATMTWTRIPGVGSVNPGPAASRGTFGRFRYIESRDLFIVVNDADLDVYVYRLP